MDVRVSRLKQVLLLPWLLLALLAQGLAPAAAAAMPRDAFGQPICTASGVGKADQPTAPTRGDHKSDCCATFCHGGGGAAPPSAHVAVASPSPLAETGGFVQRRASSFAPRGPPPRTVDATGPPFTA